MADEDTTPDAPEGLARYRAVFDGLPQGRQRLILGAGAAVLLGLGWLAVQGAMEPAWRQVARGMDATDQQAAVAALDARPIPYRLGDGGSILVPEDRIHEARLEIATSGMPSGTLVGFELFDQTELGRSTFNEQVNYHRALEGELARTIQALQPVRRARVHLTLPERALFQEDTVLPSASVVVTLGPGQTLSKRQVAAVRQLVAGAVERLAAESVSVVDQSGSMLARPESGEFQSDDALGFRGRFEQGLERRIVGLLEPLVGQGHVRAQVAVELDFSRLIETEEKFDPESQVIRSERERTENSTKAAREAEGPPGTGSNLPDRPGAQAAVQAPAGTKLDKLDHIKNYEVDRATTRRESPHARVTRLSVAVLVDSGSGEGEGPTPEQLASWQQLVSKAVGVDQARGDAVEIIAAPFTADLAGVGGDTEAQAAAAELQTSLLMWGIIGGVLLLAMILTFVLLRRRKKRRLAEDAEEQRKLEDAKRALERMPEPEPEVQEMQSIIAALRTRAVDQTGDDIWRTAAVIRGWLKEAGESEEAA